MNLSAQFKTFLESQKKRPSDTTIKNYHADVNQLVNWYEKTTGEFRPHHVTYKAIQEYLDAKKLSPSSRERHISSLRKFFTYLKEEKHISFNPLETVATKPATDNDPFRLNEFKSHLFQNKSSHLTAKNYLADIKHFTSWTANKHRDLGSEAAASTYFSLVNNSLLTEYKAALLASNLSHPSINRKLSSLRRYLHWADAQGMTEAGKPEITNISKKKEEALSASEVRDMSQEAGNQTARTSSQTSVNDPLGIINPTKASAESINELSKESTTSQPVNPLTHETVKQSKNYSSFAPLRLLQKIKGLLILAIDVTIIAGTAYVLEHVSYLRWLASGKQIFTASAKNALAYGGSENNNFSLKFPTWVSGLSSSVVTMVYPPAHSYRHDMKKHHKMFFHMRHTRPNWYKKYHELPLVHYFHFAALIILMTGLGFMGYRAFFDDTGTSQAALPTAPPRVLSFQGRLTDNLDNPITSATPLRFSLYNDLSSSGSALLWQEVQSTTPDADGIFSVLLGSETSIPDSVFRENSALYLGITVGSDSELIPRQQIATVAFAANSETLQGLLPITAAGAGTNNVVLALDSTGNLSIGGSATPTFEATGGQFTLAGDVLHLTTSAGTNSNVEVSPDGTGIIDLQKPLQNTTQNNNIDTAAGAVEVDDLFAVLATSSGQSAFTLNQDGAGPIISASSSGVARFTLSNNGTGYFAGSVGIGSTAPAYKLDVQAGSGVVGRFSGRVIGASAINSNEFVTLSQLNSGVSGSTFWQLNSNALSPINSSYDVLVGGSATSSALIKLGGTSGAHSFFNTGGNVGIGTTVPTEKLDIVGNLKLTDNTLSTETVTFNSESGSGLRISNSNGYISLTPLNTSFAHIYTDRPRFAFNKMVVAITGEFSAYNTEDLKLQTGHGANTRVTIKAADGNVGIGSTSPGYKLDVDGDIRTSGNLIEKKVTFTPTTVGWYRIVNAGGRQGGVVRIEGAYDNKFTDVELQYNIGGFGTNGSIQQTRYSSYNQGVVSQARISSDGSANTYLDIYISSATTPGPITVYAYGPEAKNFVASPVVGAVAGTTNEHTLTLGHGFRTTDVVRSDTTNESYFTGNLGIGNTNPSTQLDVTGDVYVRDGLSLFATAVSDGTIEATKFCTGDGETNCVTDFSSIIGGSSIWTDAGTYIYTTNGETLGNSAAAGANKLAGIYLANSAPLAFGNDNDISFALNDATNTLEVTQGVNDINFDSNTLFIDGSADSVGIGTSSPSEALHVSFSGVSNGILLNRTDSGKNYRFQIAGSGGLQIHNASDSRNELTFAGNGNIVFGDDLAIGHVEQKLTLHNANFIGAYNAAGTDDFKLLGSDASNNVILGNNLVTIKTDGNVGIGSTSPEAKLDVAGGDIFLDNGFYLQGDRNDGAETNLIGIDATQTIQIGEDSTFAGGININIPTDPGQALTFTSSATELARFNNFGNFGIGTTSPGYAIDVVSGDAITARFDGRVIGADAVNNDEFVTLSQLTSGTGQYWSRTGSNLYPSTISDNVGIGTSTPTFKLDVSGTGRFTGALTLDTAGTATTHAVRADRTLTAGSGLTGGGNLTANRTFNIGAGSCITVAADTVGVTSNCVDATTLDGIDSGSFLRSDTSDSFTSGTLAFNVGTTVDINGDLSIADTDIAFDGASTNFSMTGDFSINTDDLFIDKTTGNLGFGTTSPTSRLSLASDGTVANLFDITDNGSTIFQVTQSNIIANVPAQFNAAGDVSIAYDLNFTNPTASYIKSSAPLYMTAGEAFNSSDLTLRTYNSGNVIVDSQAFSVTGSASVSGQLTVEGMTTLENYTTNGGLLYTNGTGVVAQTGAGSSGQCLIGGTSPTWGSCSTGGGVTGSGTTNYITKFTSASTIGNSSIFDNGNVGIGTTNPLAKLHLSNSGSSGGDDIRIQSGAPDLTFIEDSVTADNGRWDIHLNTEQLNFRAVNDANTVGTPYLTVERTGTTIDSVSLPNGNVGVGTTSPAGKLQVAGNVLSTWSDTYFGTWFQNGSSYRLGFNTVPSTRQLNLHAYTADANGFITFSTGTVASPSEKVRITNSGNVGIGSTSPQALLDIASPTAGPTLRLGRVTGQPSIKSSADWLIMDSNTAAAAINYYVNQNVILANGGGNVGIGTSSSGEKLQVAGNIMIADGGMIRPVSTNTTRLQLYTTVDGNANSSILTGVNGMYLTADGNVNGTGHISLGFGHATNYTEAIRVQRDGNVGIGTSSPNALLAVNGHAYLNTISQGYSDDERFYPNVVSQNQNTSVTGAWIIHTPIPRDSNRMVRIRVHGYNYGDDESIDFTIVGYTYNGSTGNVDGLTGGIVAYNLQDNGTDGLSKYVGVDASGNLAIALGDITDISYFNRISVDAWITNTTEDYSTGWSIDQNTTAGFGWLDKKGPLTSDLKDTIYITSTGNVGIGSTSPAAKLDVTGTLKASGVTTLSNYTTNGGLLYTNGTGVVAQTGAGTSSQCLLGGTTPTWGSCSAGGGITGSGTTNFITKFTSAGTVGNSSIFDNGNVGIGSTSPGAKLDVAGAGLFDNLLGVTGTNGTTNLIGHQISFSRNSFNYITATDALGALSFRTGGSNDRLTILSNGNVGIGSTSPGTKLDVVGDIRTSGNVFLSSVDDYSGSNTAQKEQRTTGSVAGAGWYRVAHIDGQVGRGQNTVTLYTTGGTEAPQSTTIRWWHDWSVTAGLSVISEAGSSKWSDARVTDDGSNAYLEVYFTEAIDPLYMSLQYDGGYARGDLYTGTLVAGAGTVRASANLGLFAIGSDKFQINASGNVGIGTSNTNITNTNTSQQWGLDADDRQVVISNDTGSVLNLENTLPIDVANVGQRLGALVFSNTSGQADAHRQLTGITSRITAVGGTYTYYADLGFFTKGAGGSTEHMTITAGGNVGIGTTDPAFKLDVVSGDAIAASFDGRVIGANAVNSNEFVTLSQLTGGTGQYWTRTGTNLYPSNIGDNVGIGTTTITEKLTVGGNIGIGANRLRFANSLDFYTSGNSFYFTKIGTGGIDFQIASDGVSNANTYIDVGTNARINSGGTSYLNGGNVGIGTTAPASLLQVRGTAPSLVLNNTTTNTANSGTIDLLEDDNAFGTTGGYGFRLAYDGVGNVFNISSSNASASTIDALSILRANGNVGIGDTSPSYKLDVAGIGRFTGNLDANSGIDITSGDLTLGSAGQIDFADEAGDKIYYYSTSYGVGINSGELATWSNGSFSFRNDSRTGSEIANLGSGGRLQLDGALQVDGTADSYFIGNVGIGSTTPAAALDVVGGAAGVDIARFGRTSGAVAHIALHASGGDPTAVFSYNGTNRYALGYDVSNASFTISENSTLGANDRFVIKSGNIGIGTSAPASRLQLASDGTVNSLFNITDSGSSIFEVTQSNIVANVPAQFNAAGDVSIAYDLNFTNPTASYIKSNAPLYLTAGKTYNSSDLTLETYNKGNVNINTEALSLTGSATISAELTLSSKTTNGGILYTNGSGTIAQTSAGTSSQCLLGGTSPSWGACSAGGGVTGTGTTNYLAKFTTTGTVGNSSIFDNGNVGIGTTNPLVKLEVNGQVRSTRTNVASQYIELDGGLGDKFLRAVSNENNQKPLVITNSYVSTGSPTGSGAIQFKTGLLGSESTHMTIQTNGNIGIGTTTTPQKLTVAGSIDASVQFLGQAADSATAPSFSWTGDTNVGIFRPGTDTLGFTTGGSERMRITSNGNVGIGGTAPTSKLQIGSDTVTQQWSGSTPYVLIQGVDNETETKALQIKDENQVELFSVSTLADAGVTGGKAYFGGNVGIGTTSPLGKLNLYSTADGASYDALRINNLGTLTGTSARILFSFSNVPNIYSAAISGLRTNTPAGHSTALTFSTCVSSCTVESNLTEKMRIAADGNVGIGTANPTEKLHVSGTGNLYGYLQSSTENQTAMRFSTLSHNWTAGIHGGAGGIFKISNATALGTNDYFNIRTNGNVGIGTDTPGQKLDVNGNIRTNSDIQFFSGTTQVGQIGAQDATWLRINQNVAKNIYTPQGFRADGGISSGNYAFAANEVRADIFRGGNSSYYVRPSNTSTAGLFAGNVGIGTTSPSTLLALSGGIASENGYNLQTGGTDNMLVNGDFEQGGTYGWTGVDTVVTGGYAGNYAGQTAGSQSVLSDDYIPVDPTRDVIQLEGYFKKTVAGTTPGVIYFGYRAYDANKTVITTSPCGSYCYFAAAGYTLPVDGAWHKFSATTTGEGTSYPNFPVGTKFIRVLVLINYSGSVDSVTQMDHVSVKKINNGPLFVGNNFASTNMEDQFQVTKLFTTSGDDFIIEPPTGGNVGIGSTSPAYQLDIVSGDAISARFDGRVIGSAAVNSNEFVTLSQLTGGTGQYWTLSGNNLYPSTIGNNVGIGTSAPSAKLDVNGSIRGNNGLTISSGTISLPANEIDSSEVNFNYAGSISKGGPALTLYREDNRTISPSELTAGEMKFGFTSYNNNNVSPYADFLHFRSYLDSSGGSDNLLVLNKTSGLGMRLYQQTFGSATAYSTYKDIALVDNGSTLNYLPKFSSVGNTVSMTNSTIYDNGNVGIGSTAPAYKLDVNGTARFSSTANPGVVVGNGSTGYLQVGSSGWYDDGNYFSPSGSRHFYIRSTTPTTYIYSNTTYLGATSGDNTYLRGNNLSGDNFAIPASGNTYFNNGGNVGIGTTSPTAKLDVAGDQYISGFLRSPNIISGNTYSESATITRAVNEAEGWVKIWDSGGGSVYTTNFRITGGYNNRQNNLEFRVSASGYGQPHSIVMLPTTNYNGGTVGEIRTQNVSSTQLEVWIKLDAVNATQPGSVTVYATDQKLEDTLTATTVEPIWGTRSVAINPGFDIDDLPLQLTSPLATRMVEAPNSGGLSLFDDGGNGIFVRDGGNIGVGNTSPGTKLDVTGTFRASGVTTLSNYTTNGGLLYTNGTGVVAQTGAGTGSQCLLGGTTPTWGACSTGSVTGSGSTNYIAKFTGAGTIGNSLLYDNGTNVGIGSTSPGVTLDIAATNAQLTLGGTNYAKQRIITTNDTQSAGLWLSHNTADTQAGIVMYGDVMRLGQATADSSGLGAGLNIDRNNNVGIGTTAPGAELDIASGSMLFNNTDYAGVYFGSVFKDAAAHSGAWAYIRQTAANGQLEIGSDANVEFYETDSRVLRSNFDLNTGTFSFNGTLQAMNSSGLGIADDAGTVGLWVEDGANVGIGTTNPTGKLEVVGSSYLRGQSKDYFAGQETRTYRNLAQFNNDAANVTGTVKIALPTAKNNSTTMQVIKITGYSYVDNGGAWEAIVSGYNHTGGWINTSAEIRGSAPFTSIRMGTDGTTDVILLGDTTTVWQYPQIFIDTVHAGYTNQDGYDDTWTISMITSEVGITVEKTPSIKTYIASNGNMGIGTTNPGQKLDVSGNIRTSGQLISTVGTGTSPLAVSSTTVVANLNADLLDGLTLTSASTANTVVARNGSGDINARLFRSEYDSTNGTIGYIMTQIDTVSNNYIRPSTPAQLVAGLGLEAGGSRDIWVEKAGDTMTGQLNMSGASTGPAYSQAPIEIIEAYSAGAGQAPAIAFHYSGQVASQIGFLKGDGSGDISILDNPGTGYETLRVRDLKIGTTAVIDGSRNLVNIGTVDTSLTLGSVAFAGSGGVLSEDNANFYFDNTNNRLGIGTNAPSYGIAVAGAGVNGGVAANTFYDHDNPAYYLDPAATGTSMITAGNVGIGTTNPTSKLMVDRGEIGISQQNSSTTYMRLGQDTSWVQYVANNAYWTGTEYNYVSTGGYGGLASRMGQSSGDIYFDTASGGVNPISWNRRMTIADNGNVTVNGNLCLDTCRSTWPTSSGGTVTGTGTTNYLAKFTAAGAIGNSLIFDNGTNVGIGSTVPGGVLDIAASTSTVTLLLGRASGQPSIKSTGDWLIMDSNTQPAALNYYTSQNVVLAFGGGNVGIADTSPSFLLDIAGTLNANGHIYGNSKEIFNTSDSFLRFNQSTAFSSGIWMGNSNLLGAGGGYIGLGSSGGTTSSRVYIYGGAYNGTNVIKIDGSSSSSTSYFNAGNVGIGTTSPEQKLHVAGNIHMPAGGNLWIRPNGGSGDTGNRFRFHMSTGGDSYIDAGDDIFFRQGPTSSVSTVTFLANGNVGIGTTNPTSKLRVEGGLYVNGSSHVTDTMWLGSGATLWQMYTRDDRDYPNECDGAGSAAPFNDVMCWNSSDDAAAEMSIDQNGWLAVDSGVDGGNNPDIAEHFPVNDPSINRGDILVATDPSGLSKNRNIDNVLLTKSTQPYQPGVVGGVSTNPSFLIGTEGMIGHGEDRVINGDMRAVGLAGRIPMKVSTINGAIKAGDNITTSTIPGVGMKATKEGYIVGRALQDFDGTAGEFSEVIPCSEGTPAGVTCGKIIVFINNAWADPEVQLADSGNLTITGTDTDSFTAWVGQYKFEKRAGFADAVIARLVAGITTTQQLVVNGQTQLLGTVKIGTQTLQEFIITVVQNAGFTNSNDVTSPIASIDKVNTDVISPLSKNAVTIDGDASVSGTLRAKKIIADEIEGLDAKIASLSAGTITATQAAITNITNITNIYQTASDSAKTATDSAQIATDSAQVATDSATASDSAEMTEDFTNSEIQTEYMDLASSSAALAYTPTLSSEFATFTKGLMSFGPSTFADAAVTGQFSVNGTLILAENSINTLGGTLEIQPLAQGDVSFMAGMMTLDTDGNLNVNGNAYFAKDVTVRGTLAAGIISPVPSEDLIIRLPSMLADGPNRDSKLVIQNASGSGVLEITNKGDLTASGSGQFAHVTAEGFQIIRGAQADISATETIASASAGVAIINRNYTERTIISEFVTEDSLIYLTPVGSTNGLAPYVARQTAADPENNVKGSFTIQIPARALSEMKINWFIVN